MDEEKAHTMNVGAHEGMPQEESGLPKPLKIFLIVTAVAWSGIFIILGIQDYKNGLLIDLHSVYWLLVKTGIATVILIFIPSGIVMIVKHWDD